MLEYWFRVIVDFKEVKFIWVCPTFYMRRNFEILIKTVEQILFDPVPDNCHLPLYTPE